ncbi:MAG: TetR/AcrR family transcriptional regulator [Bacteroidales bacterium]|nr:TetR/AcrR family transcriptional regulator [Bacteroidales bacterium]
MDVRERIMHEFVQQLTDMKCKEIKVENIASEIGISKRTLYETFRSKEELIETTLLYYQKKHHEEIKEACKDVENSFEKALLSLVIMYNHFKFLNINKMYSLKKQYPEIADKIIKQHMGFMNQYALNLIKKVRDDGYLYKDVDPEMLLIMLTYINSTIDSNKPFQIYNKKYDGLTFLTIHAFAIIRGFCTKKGLDVCGKVYEKYIKQDSDNYDKSLHDFLNNK